MKRFIFLTAVLVGLIAAGSYWNTCVQAQHQHGSGQAGHAEHAQPQAVAVGSPITVTGEIIDPVCYIRMDMKGAKHKACAETCAKGGVTLAVLEDGTGKIYIAMPEGHGDPNAKLMAHVAQHVKVTGVRWEKGGYAGIEVKTVEKM